MKKNRWRGLFPISTALLATALGCTSLLWQWSGLVDEVLGIKKQPTASGGTTVYASSYGDLTEENRAKMLADLKQHIIKEEEEGAVLLKNDGVLPLQSVKKVTLLGRATVDPVYRYTSGGPSWTGTSLRQALEDAGLEINGIVFSAYEASTCKRDKATGDIGEVGEDFYTQNIVDSFRNYADAAIVMISRYGGEGTDLLRKDKDGVSQLSLHESEKATLRMARANFKKVILLVNSGNPVELGWMDSEEYGVDACLWIGTPGNYGFTGVVNLLMGTANPSGGLIDTYATNSLSAAATQNFGDYTYANADEYGLTSKGIHDVTNKYLVEAEGIYVGYRYYETRYEDCILNQGNASSSAGVFASRNGSWNYADEVIFPFGYGLSYTEFERKITACKTDGEEDAEFTLSVNVTNTGSVAGKTPVQIYVQTPYTAYDRDNLVEKSAIQLVGFGKTGVLQPGESEQVEVTVDRYLLASYDSTACGGKGGYILDEGTYYFAVGNGAHEALNNVLAAKGATGMYDEEGNPVEGDVEAVASWELAAFDESSYHERNGVAVENKLQDADINFWIPNAVTYLTRQNWDTFPKETTVLNATKEMADSLNADNLGDKSFESYQKPSSAPSKNSFKQGQEVTLKLADLKGVPYDDARWDTFLNQLTIAQLATMTSDMSGIKAIKDVGFPGISQNDGPDGAGGVQYVGQSVAAATFSPEILAERGFFFAEEALFNGKNAVWSPGADIHRTPFGGRNFEYYSEDSYMSYLCAAIQCREMQNKGLSSSIKHFCGNDQETNRYGLCTFTTEQAWRQGPLRGFEGAFTEGGATSTMTSYSRYGLTLTCESNTVNNEILRGEWGFVGFTITDAGSGSPIDSIIGGTDVFCLNDNAKTLNSWITKQDDGNLLAALRKANKNIFYTFVNGNLGNVLSSDLVISSSLSWWQVAVIALDCILGLAVVGCGVLYVLKGYVLSRKEEK